MNDVVRIEKLTRAILGLTLFLIGLGAYVRHTGAGLSCPDWPLCFGQIIPPLEEHGVFQEVFHRVVAGIVSLLTVVLAFRASRMRFKFPRVWKQSLLLMGIIAIQVVFGALTVTEKLNPWIVSTHLAFATLYFQIVGLMFIEAMQFRRRSSPAVVEDSMRSPARWFLFAAQAAVVMTFLQILLGGFVAASGAALVCPDFPGCVGNWAGNWMPASLTYLQNLQMLHRAVGVLLILTVVSLVFSARGAGGLAAKRRGHLFGVLFMSLLQLALGVANIYFYLPIPGTIAHLIVAQLILFAIGSFDNEIRGGQRLFQTGRERREFPSLNEIGVISRRSEKRVQNL